MECGIAGDGIAGGGMAGDDIRLDNMFDDDARGETGTVREDDDKDDTDLGAKRRGTKGDMVLKDGKGVEGTEGTEETEGTEGDAKTSGELWRMLILTGNMFWSI